jgi:hypothetical protein
MEIDLRKNGRMSVDLAKYISEIEPSVREEYNHYIGELTKINNLSGIDLLLQASCRNTNLSYILDRFCRIRLLESLIKSGKAIDKVIVDSVCMKSVCERLIKKYDVTTIVVITSNNLGEPFRLIKNIVKSIYMMLCLFIIPKIVLGNKRIPNGPIIYLENFIFIDSFDSNGVLKDRYYPGLADCLEDKALEEKIWYVPTLIGFKKISQYYSIFKKIRTSKVNILLKEDWLELKDYLSAFKTTLVLHKKINKIPMWNGIDVSDIVSEELNKEIGSTSLLNSLLLYKFIQRLKDKDVDIDIVIDWNENQVIDRALNLAINKFYPDVYVKGYQGYVVPDFYTCKDPTVFEVEADTVPDEVCVVGEAFVSGKKRYCPDLNVSVAPGYRFSNSHDSKYLNRDKSLDILIVLPMSLADSVEILAICIKLSKVDGIGDKYNFIVKHHPSLTIEQFVLKVPEALNACFKFSDKPLYEHMCKSSLLISALSSVCLEAAVLAVPVAIIGSRSGPVMNPLAGLEGIESWKVCYNENEISELLVHNIANQVSNIEYYFQSNTVERAREFVSCPQSKNGEHDVL